MRTIAIAFFLASVFAFAGCAPSIFDLRAMTAEATGCPEMAVTLEGTGVGESPGRSDRKWTARCQGKSYICVKKGRSEGDVVCEVMAK